MSRRDCACPQASHQHGSYLAYLADGCRCLPCRADMARNAQARRKRDAFGRSPWTTAAQSRQHLAALQRSGMGLKRIAEQAGIAHTTVARIAKVSPTSRVHRDTEKAILAVQPNLSPGAMVDATGSRRRLRALATIGYPSRHLGRLLGMSAPVHLVRVTSGKQPRVQLRTAQAIARLYDELCMTPYSPEDLHNRLAATRTRNMAHAAGWAPPLAWDEGSIDDPRARPRSWRRKPAG